MKTYFASDFHFGTPKIEDNQGREKRLIRWLDSIKDDADKVFLMGDLFDFWFEYGTVIPKGHLRVLGKIAELVDKGIEVHFFIGNHDLWQFGYLEKEVGVIVHKRPEVISLDGKRFLLAHGDALGPGDKGYKFMKRIFECKFNQFLFRWLHPDIGIRFALWCSYKSRLGKNLHGRKFDEHFDVTTCSQYKFAEMQVENNPDIDFVVFGHVHYPIEKMMNEHTKFMFLGDWITHFTFAIFDGNDLELRSFTE